MRKFLSCVWLCYLVIALCQVLLVNCAVLKSPKSLLKALNDTRMYEILQSMPSQDAVAASKQLLILDGKSKETNAPNFVRLVVMRLIYGLASTMGVEERLDEAFNGAFVPPNANDDDFGFGYDDSEGEGVGALFDADY